MILTFPDLDTVRLALTSGAVPSAAALAPAVARFEAGGRVWVETAVDLPRKSLAELRRQGAGTGKPPTTVPAIEVSCWPQLLPLQRSADRVARPRQTPVLFELAEGEPLTSLVSEVLRLGNDRQGYRGLEDPKGKAPGRALLRVVGPPYYSLLRAIDRDGQASAPVAYVEQAPRVWVQLGYRHPLADHIKPALGQLLFLRPPRRWAVIEDAPFRDIYEVLEFALPGQKTRWQEGELSRRLTVPLRLARGGPSAAPELWVLRENAVDQLDELVRGADDGLLSRLAFAVGERNGEKIIVLKVRPSKLAPPALVLDAREFCHFQKLPNLFLPAGTRLHPPLRRDTVRKHLADDPALVTWLYPEPDGGFTPESLPDSAFRPLSDWIDYVLEHDHEPLQAWIESARFEFEPFVCDEDDRPKPTPRAKAPPRSSAPRLDGGKAPADGNGESKKASAEKAPEDEPLVAAVAAPHDELRQQLDVLEQRFLAVEGGLDAPERQALWPEMAALNARLDSADDAGVCWMNALWAGGEARTAPALAWFRAEAQAVPMRNEAGWPKGHTWATAAALAPRGAAVDGASLDLLLKLAEPSPADARALAAYVFWAGCRKEPPEGLVTRLGQIAHFLETHDRLIPVRAVWLASLGLHRLAGGDALGLARARDRLLERLFRGGLRPEQDLASFLRFSGPAGNQRLRAVRQWLAELAEKAQRWAETTSRDTSIYAPKKGHQSKTPGYVDLTFAFGMARLGEIDASNRFLERARASLAGSGPATQFLFDAYCYRIQQAQQAQPPKGPLPAEQSQILKGIYEEYHKNSGANRDGERHTNSGIRRDGTEVWYTIDKLRSESAILEPDQRLEPYRQTHPAGNERERTILELPDVIDAAEVVATVRGLLQSIPANEDPFEDRVRVLRAALNQSPRVGEEFALEMLALAPAAFDALPPPVHKADFERRARFLERALYAAARFDQTASIQQIVARFARLLDPTPTAEALGELVPVVSQSLRSLRKFGMTREMDDLLQRMAQAVLKGHGPASLTAEVAVAQPEILQALLYLAGGWYYLGKQGDADSVVELARTVLLTPPPQVPPSQLALGGHKPLKRVALACAYASALSQAPVDVAQRRFEELFEHLKAVDAWTTAGAEYSVYPLKIIEAVTLAIVSDDFTVGPAVRRWLDEDEHLVRRRIHQDVRALVPH
jgi:hypothetical protein